MSELTRYAHLVSERHYNSGMEKVNLSPLDDCCLKK
jgi:hypothetical protein